MDPLLEYHEATKHSPASVQSSRFRLDWANRPVPFKVYTSLPPIPLPREFHASAASALDALAGSAVTAPAEEAPLNLELLARLCYFANGITRVLQRHDQRIPFRAAACTGALYHIELYLVCSDLADLEAGVYHYAAHDNALRLLRRGDFRRVLSLATGDEPSIAGAPAVMVCTTTYWRNAWKYQARAYRHAFWDTGTIVANLLGVASANNLSARMVVGFADAPVNALLDIDPAQEAAICLVSLGRGDKAAPVAPPLDPLRLPTQALSVEQVDYPQIVDAHAASSLASGSAASAWRASASAWRTAAHVADPGSPAPAPAHPTDATLAPRAAPSPGDSTAEMVATRPDPATKPASGDVPSAVEPPLDAAVANQARGRVADSIEQVILRRGSSRRFSTEPIGLDQLMDMLIAATGPIPSDVHSQNQSLTEAYLIVNAVDGLASGAYVFHKTTASLELLKPGDFRHQAAFLDLGQDLAGQAALNVYWLADLNAVLDRLGSRGYRAAQLEAAVEGGKLYLAAYALGLGATGLTFFDDEVTRFFSPQAASKSVMFLDALGRPAKRSV